MKNKDFYVSVHDRLNRAIQVLEFTKNAIGLQAEEECGDLEGSPYHTLDMVVEELRATRADFEAELSVG